MTTVCHLRHKILGIAILVAVSSTALVTSINVLAADGDAIEEVLVTARRVEENPQDVPMTVTAVSPTIMERENIIRPTDLTYTVPSLTIAPSFNTLNNGYSVRGLAAGVATYFAESPCCIGNSSIPFLDIQLIQALNGPQGTLFGRTSGSGAILIEPVRPDLEAAGGLVKVRLGDYGRAEITGTYNQPITDELAVRIAANSMNLDGYTKQTGGGPMLDEQKNQQLRLGLLFNHGQFTNYTVANVINLDQSASNEVLAAINTNIGLYNLPAAAGPAVLGTACAGAVSIGLNPDVQSCINERLAYLSYIKSTLIAEMDRINKGDNDAIRSTPTAVNGNPTFLRLKNWSVINSAEISDLEWGGVKFNVKDILSYERNTNNTGNPADGIGGVAEQAGAFNTAGVGANNTSHGKVVARLGPATRIVNNDLKGYLDFADGLVTGTLGYFYSHYKNPATDLGTGNIYQIFGGVLNADRGYNSALDFRSDSNGGQRAWYTQWMLDTSTLGVEGLQVTAGYRYSWDRNLVAGRAPVFDLPSGSYSPGAYRQTYDASKGYNYLLSVSKSFGPDVLVYASQSRAYIPGFINQLIQNAGNLPNYKPIVGPQIVVVREVGGKFDFDVGDMPARLNLALYDYDFTDIAVGFSGFTGTVSVGYSANVAAAQFRGAELTGAIKPTDNWEFSFAYNYNDAKYTDWTASDPHNAARPGDAICSPISQPKTCLIDLTANPFFRMPENQGHVTAAYSTALAANKGELTLSLSVYAQSLVWYNSSALRLLEVLPTAKPGISQGGYSIVNFRANWSDVMGSGFDGALFVNNLTDTVYKLGATPQLLTLGFSIATYAPPRMIGVELSKNF